MSDKTKFLLYKPELDEAAVNHNRISLIKIMSQPAILKGLFELTDSHLDVYFCYNLALNEFLQGQMRCDRKCILHN